MASEAFHVLDPSPWTLARLWLIAIAGLFLPTFALRYVPESGWAGESARAHQQSLKAESWQDPWKPIDQDGFSSGWIRCERLEDALALDRLIDDGFLDQGNLILAEGGLAWIPK